MNGSTTLADPLYLPWEHARRNLPSWPERAIENSLIWLYCINKDPLLLRCDRQWNEPKCMDKPRRLLVQARAKWLVLLAGLGFFISECPRLFAQINDPGLLNQQVNKLYQEGKYQEAIPIAERAVEVAKRVRGPEHLDTATSLNSLADCIEPWASTPKPSRSIRKRSGSGRRS